MKIRIATDKRASQALKLFCKLFRIVPSRRLLEPRHRRVIRVGYFAVENRLRLPV
jgi:hypothetical protein